MEQTKLSWQTVDMTTLPPHVREAFDKISAAKADFERIFTAALSQAGAIPAGLEPKFSDKWGKLSIAFAKASGNSGNSGPFRLTPTASQASAPLGATPPAPAPAPTPAAAQGGKAHK